MVLVIDVSHVGYSCVVGSWLVGEGKNLYRLMSARGCIYCPLYHVCFRCFSLLIHYLIYLTYSICFNSIIIIIIIRSIIIHSLLITYIIFILVRA